MKPSLYQVIDRLQELKDENYTRNEDFEDHSIFYESEDNLRWIWRKGVSFGKKMVVTGVVVSSAPFLLPPLVALSAIGFAFSLPASFLFATFACTNKLMNTLLPMSSQPPYLGSRTTSSDEEEYRIYNDDEVDKGYEEDDDEDDISVREKEYEEDTRNETENRIELVEEYDRDVRASQHVTPIDNKDEQGTQMSGTEIVEESGYEDDVGEYMDTEEQALDSTPTPTVVEEIPEAEDRISMENEGVKIPEDFLPVSGLEAELGDRNEENVGQGKEGLAFLTQRNTREENEIGDLADIDEDDVGQYIDTEEQALDSTPNPSVREGIPESENGISMENDGIEIPEEFLPALGLEAEWGDRNAENIEQEKEELAFVPQRSTREENENNEALADFDEDDVGEYIDTEEQALDSTLIHSVREGIPESEDGISMKNEGIEIPEEFLRALGLEAEGGDRNAENIEQEKEELAFVPQRSMREENENNGDLANIDEDELRNETTGLLERIRDEGKEDYIKRKSQENEQNGGIVMKDMPKEKGTSNLSVIPEEVKPAVMVGSKDLNETVDKRGEKRYETGISQEQPEVVIERMLVVNVKASDGNHTTTDVHEGTSSDEKIGTLILSSVEAVEMANETDEVPDKLADLLNEGDDLASESAIDVSFDYHEVRIASIPVSNHAATGLDQESTADSVKELVNEEKIWKQIHAIRTIVGYNTVPLASCVEELKALYVFTGVELPVSTEDSGDLADVNEKLHFLMSIVGVK